MKYDDKPGNPHSAPALMISFGMGPPSGKKGKKKGKEAKARQAIAKSEVKKGLQEMYDSWKPDKDNKQAVAYNNELKGFIDSMEG